LRCENLRTYERVDLDIPEGLTAIVGPNGSGKSTLANAIDVALFGADGRSLAPLFSDGAAGDLLVELEFSHAGGTFRVRRGYCPAGRGRSTLDFEAWIIDVFDPGLAAWAPLTRETQEQTQESIDAVLHFDRETFRASSFLAQGEGDSFTTAQPRDRKRILGQILGLSVYDRLLELVRVDKKIAETRVAELSGAIERAEAELAERGTVSERPGEAASVEASLTAALDEAEDTLAGLNKRYMAAKSAVERRQSAEAALTMAREAYDRQRQSEFTVVYEAWRARSRARDQQIAESDRLKVEAAKLSAGILELSDKAALLKVSADRLDRPGDETCDRCGQELHAEARQRALVSIEAEIVALEARGGQLADELQALPSWMALRRQAERILVGPEPVIDSHDFGDRLSLATEAITSAETLVSFCISPEQLTKLVRAGHVAKAEVDSQRARLDVARAEKVRLEEKTARLKTVGEQQGAYLLERGKLRDDLALLAILERAFGRNGIPALILESTAIPAIETEASRIMQALAGEPGHPVRCELLTQRETKTGSLSDVLDIVLFTGDDTPRPYESFSGGERTRADLALRIALARLLANRRGADSQLLVIDEPSGLDEQGMAALVEVLRGLQDEFAVQLIVSHVPALRDAFDHSIQIVKDEQGRSRIVGDRDPVGV
jgi:exonuclease SbcC